MTDFNSNLGIQLGEDGHSVVLDTQPEHQVLHGMIHFAILTTMAEVAAAQVAEVAVVPAALSVNLLRPATPGRLVGRGTLIRRGRRLIVADGAVYQGDRLVAKATVTFAVL